MNEEFLLSPSNDDDPTAELIAEGVLGSLALEAAALFGSAAAAGLIDHPAPNGLGEWCERVARLGREAVLRVAIAACEAVYPVAQLGGAVEAEDTVAGLRLFLANPCPEAAELCRSAAADLSVGESAEVRIRASAAVSTLDFAVDLLLPHSNDEELARTLRFLLDEATLAVSPMTVQSIVRRALLHWVAVFGPDWSRSCPES